MFYFWLQIYLFHGDSSFETSSGLYPFYPFQLIIILVGKAKLLKQHKIIVDTRPLINEFNIDTKMC